MPRVNVGDRFLKLIDWDKCRDIGHKVVCTVAGGDGCENTLERSIHEALRNFQSSLEGIIRPNREVRRSFYDIYSLEGFDTKEEDQRAYVVGNALLLYACYDFCPSENLCRGWDVRQFWLHVQINRCVKVVKWCVNGDRHHAENPTSDPAGRPFLPPPRAAALGSSLCT